MDRDMNNFNNDEDLKWLLENPLPDSPGLFSKSPTWFRFSAYEIKEVNESLYICPRPGASCESYKPFEKFPQLMSDFIALLINIDKLPKTFDNVKSSLHFQELCKTRERDCAHLLLEFTNKYGLFGIMYEYIESLDPCRMKDGEDDFENLIVVLNKKVYRLSALNRKILNSFTDEGIYNFTPMMKYDDLCSYFLPSAKGAYPKIKSEQFREYYSEKVNDIFMNENLRRITMHIRKMKEFSISNASAGDNSPYLRNMVWGNYLRETISGIGLSYTFDWDYNKWDLSWSFKSLIGALSIMYFMNLTGKLGSDVHVCRYSKCDKIVIDRNCCCEKHDNAYRKAKERARKGKQKEVPKE